MLSNQHAYGQRRIHMHWHITRQNHDPGKLRQGYSYRPDVSSPVRSHWFGAWWNLLCPLPLSDEPPPFALNNIANFKWLCLHRQLDLKVLLTVGLTMCTNIRLREEGKNTTYLVFYGAKSLEPAEEYSAEKYNKCDKQGHS